MKISRIFSVQGLILLALLAAGCQRISNAIEKRLSDPANSNPASVSLNKRGLPNPGSTSFRFLVIGHGYGSTRLDDHLPARALLQKVPELTTMDLSMLVSLGDIVQHSIAGDFDNLKTSLLDPLPFPVLNIPGNHDVVNRSEYESRYGKTFYSFRVGSAQMIFLDTERESCAIDAEQEKMLSSVISSSLNGGKIQNIFIFMHKTLFFKNDRLAQLNQPKGLPNVMECYGSQNFPALIDKTILPAAQKKPVYIFAGDVGAWENLSPYYEKRTDADLTMVMTGLGDYPDDSGILVAVDGIKVQMQAYSLTGQAMQPLETYSPDYWIGVASQE
jgi:hypothetical protein